MISQLHVFWPRRRTAREVVSFGQTGGGAPRPGLHPPNADLVRRGAFTPPYPMAEIRRCGGVKISLNPVHH
jgi:hypothetical protein